MTLVFSLINAACVVQASDRLTTRWQNNRLLGQHDPLANKTVVYLASDGPMILSFAGVAYVGSEPTDEWIARHLIGEAHHRWPDGRIPTIGFRRTPLKRFNEAAWGLQCAIQAEKAFEPGLEVAIAGWRVRRRRLSQTGIIIVKNGASTVRHGHMRLRTKHFGSSMFSVGASVDFKKIEAAASEHRNSLDFLLSASVRSEFLAEMIRRESETNGAVGGDVMAVEIPRWRANETGVVRVRFKPKKPHKVLVSAGERRFAAPAAYWPWVITPAMVRAPSVSIGSGMSMHACGWTFLFEYDLPEQTPGLFFAEMSISRPPPAS